VKLIDTSNKMKQWRKRLGITQVKAAELLGVSERMYIRYETNENNITKTIALLAAYVERDFKN
jgi:transcriptional regulator with XRE-family HTH domain